MESWLKVSQYLPGEEGSLVPQAFPEKCLPSPPWSAWPVAHVRPRTPGASPRRPPAGRFSIARHRVLCPGVARGLAKHR